jgi:hypothetical protein
MAQLGDAVIRPAQLKGPNRQQVFPLEKNVIAGDL